MRTYNLKPKAIVEEILDMNVCIQARELVIKLNILRDNVEVIYEHVEVIYEDE